MRDTAEDLLLVLLAKVLGDLAIEAWDMVVEVVHHGITEEMATT
jgi:hypothetical protein